MKNETSGIKLEDNIIDFYLYLNKKIVNLILIS